MMNPATARGVNGRPDGANIAEMAPANLSFIQLARSLTALRNYIGAAQRYASNVPYPRDRLLIEFLDKSARECEEASRLFHQAYSPSFHPEKSLAPGRDA